MKKRTLVLGGLVLAALAVAALGRTYWNSTGAVAQAPPGQQSGPRAIPVQIATAIKKKVPVQIEALGTVTPIASVAIKSRRDTEIVGVHFADGAAV
jgi:multidrug efflux system membrane fusion protein